MFNKQLKLETFPLHPLRAQCSFNLMFDKYFLFAKQIKMDIAKY